MDTDEAMTRWIYAEDALFSPSVYEIIGAVVLYGVVALAWYLL